MMKKFKNVLISKENVGELTAKGVDPKMVEVMEHMLSNQSSLTHSLTENGLFGMSALEMAEDMVDLGFISENILDKFETENEVIDKAMGEAISEGGERDLVDESEIWAMLAE